FQTGEIITFYMLGFTILMTVSVVVYYKYMSHSKLPFFHCHSAMSVFAVIHLFARVSGRPMDTVVGKNRKIQKMTKCDEFTDRFVRRR
ncbi:hypothetical protein Angca_001713, partial [Angiostrongylus cantonensis]